MLHNAVIVVMCTHLQSILLAMLTMKKSCMGFYFYACMWFSSYSMVLPLAALAARAPLLIKVRLLPDNIGNKASKATWYWDSALSKAPCSSWNKPQSQDQIADYPLSFLTLLKKFSLEILDLALKTTFCVILITNTLFSTIILSNKIQIPNWKPKLVT